MVGNNSVFLIYISPNKLSSPPCNTRIRAAAPKDKDLVNFWQCGFLDNGFGPFLPLLGCGGAVPGGVEDAAGRTRQNAAEGLENELLAQGHCTRQGQ